MKTITETAAIETILAELKWLALAVCQDSTRPSIARVQVDGAHAVATDGHRMHIVDDTALPPGFNIRADDLALILELSKRYQLTQIEVWDSASRWHFERVGGTCVLEVDLVDPGNGVYKFPEWERILPRGVETELKTADVRRVYEGTETKPDFCALGEGHVNARYVAEALRGAPKTVHAVLSADEHEPVMFRYHNRRAVVMPLRK